MSDIGDTGWAAQSYVHVLRGHAAAIGLEALADYARGDLDTLGRRHRWHAEHGQAADFTLGSLIVAEILLTLLSRVTGVTPDVLLDMARESHRKAVG